MQLSKFSDYAFRALIYLANNRDKLCTVEELARELETSPHHMKKVVHKLASFGYIDSLKGRNGGLRLGMNPGEINLGEVLKITEENMNIFDCFQDQNDCPMLKEGCRLKRIAYEAMMDFTAKFSGHTLQDLIL